MAQGRSMCRYHCGMAQTHSPVRVIPLLTCPLCAGLDAIAVTHALWEDARSHGQQMLYCYVLAALCLIAMYLWTPRPALKSWEICRVQMLGRLHEVTWLLNM